MISLHDILDQAVPLWKRFLQGDARTYKYSHMPVLRSDPNADKEALSHDWFFFTREDEKIRALINNDANIQKKFVEYISPIWGIDPTSLALELTKCNLLHESFHHMDAPMYDSDDRREIRQAIFRGVKKALKVNGLRKRTSEGYKRFLERMVKIGDFKNVRNVDLLHIAQGEENGIDDAIIDNRQVVENDTTKFTEHDVMAIWNLMGMYIDGPIQTTVSLQTLAQRLEHPQTLRGMTIDGIIDGKTTIPVEYNDMCTWITGQIQEFENAIHTANGNNIPMPVMPEYAISLLRSPKNNDIFTIVSYVYGALYGPVQAEPYFRGHMKKHGVEIAVQILNEIVQGDYDITHTLVDQPESFFNHQKEMRSKVRDVLKGEGRYKAIERVMGVLAYYANIPLDGGPGLSGCGGCQAGSTGSWLEDLKDYMDPDEWQEFLEDLQQDVQNDRKNHGTDKDTMRFPEVDGALRHQWYKTHHPRIHLQKGTVKGEKIMVGKELEWELVNTDYVSPSDAALLDLDSLVELNHSTGLPWLTMSNGLYIVNTFDTIETDVTDISYVDMALETPHLVRYYLDSSQSMDIIGSVYGWARNEKRFNDGSRWDLLCQVIYGFSHALVQANEKIRKTTMMEINNFAAKTVTSRRLDVKQFWHSPSPNDLRALYNPDNGGSTHLDIDINCPADTTYVIATDGDLNSGSDTQADKIISLAARSDVTVILFEIGGQYVLGRAVQDDPNVNYFQVHDYQKMFTDGLEVMLGR